MARKKVTLARMADDSARKASLKKRSCGLMKKVYELTILCDTSASVIIYNPDDKQLMTWPPHAEALKILTRFFSMPEMQQKKKMINQETYLAEKVSKMQEQLKKYQRKHREIEIFNLMQYVDQGNDLDKLNVNDLKSLVQFSEEKLKEIRKRVEYCQQIPLFPSSLPLAPLSPSAFAPDPAPMLVLDQMAANIRDNIGGLDHHDHHGKALVESTQWDQWFTNMNNNSDNIAGSSKMSKNDHMAGLSASYQSFEGIKGGSEIALGMQPYRNVETGCKDNSADMGLPSDSFRGNIIASDIELPYDVTKEWPTNYNP